MAKNIQKKSSTKKDTNLDWHLTRRSFMRSILAGGIIASIPFSVMASVSEYSILSDKQIKLVFSIQQILFPSDGNGPGAKDLMADRYLIWVLSDKRMDPEEKDYIISGIGWIEETAEEIYSSSYNSLSQEYKELLLDNISKESWGKSWLGVILNFIFEAMLCDPQYGGNPENIGWQWLDHNPGFPRPTKSLLYPEIISTVANNN